MKIYTYDCVLPASSSNYIPEHSVFLDIETTGLSKEHSIVYMIGLSYLERESDSAVFHTIQYFNEDSLSEKALLLSLLSFLKEYDPAVLTTFNGERFDLPFIRQHLLFHDLDETILDRYPVFDLYRKLVPFQNALGLINGKQKTWEAFLGIHREDIYDGKKLISIYKEYILTKDPSLCELLLLHNKDDMEGMGLLCGMIPHIRLLSNPWTIDNISTEYSVKNEELCIIEFTTQYPLARELFLCSDQYEFEGNGNRIILKIRTLTAKLHHYFPDYKDYYYLPDEQRAIHKSVAIYTDPSVRRKATASDCYYTKEGVFFPYPHKCKKYGLMVDNINNFSYIAYKRDALAKDFYLEFDDIFLNDESSSKLKYIYFHDILRFLLIQRV